MKATMRRINTLGVMWIITVAALGAWFGYMLLDDQMPLVYEQNGAVIMPDPAEQGGRVIVKLTVTKWRSCPGFVHRQLRDEGTAKTIALYDPIPETMADIPVGTTTQIGKTFELPEGLPPVVRYQATVCFRCNVLQDFRPLCAKTPDIVFRVTQRPPF